MLSPTQQLTALFLLKKALKNLTFENPASIDGILMNLEKRLKERSWIVSIVGPFSVIYIDVCFCDTVDYI